MLEPRRSSSRLPKIGAFAPNGSVSRSCLRRYRGVSMRRARAWTIWIPIQRATVIAPNTALAGGSTRYARCGAVQDLDPGNWTR